MDYWSIYNPKGLAKPMSSGKDQPKSLSVEDIINYTNETKAEHKKVKKEYVIEFLRNFIKENSE